MTVQNIDIDCSTDLSPGMGLVEDSTAIKQAIVRRLMTQRGGLWYSEAYGFDIRRMLNAPMTKKTVWKIQAAIYAQAMADERVKVARCIVEWIYQTSTLRVNLALQTDLGPVNMTMEISDLTIALLEGTST